MYTRADPGTAWDRGRCVHCPAVGGAMAVSIVAATDIRRGFTDVFLLLLDLGWTIKFLFFFFFEKCEETARHQRSWKKCFHFERRWHFHP